MSHSSTKRLSNSDLVIIEHGMIESPRDLFKLGIVDWNRLNGYWPNPADALDSISNWVVGRMHHHVIDVDMRKVPKTADLSKWKHTGSGHNLLAEEYGSWFSDWHSGEIHWSDEPDFYGTITDGGDPIHFYGDIGKVSVSTFLHTIQNMREYELWVSVPSEKKQITLEAMCDFYMLRDFED